MPVLSVPETDCISMDHQEACFKLQQIKFASTRLAVSALRATDKELYLEVMTNSLCMQHIGAPLSIEQAEKDFSTVLRLKQQKQPQFLFSVALIESGQKIGIASVDKLDLKAESADLGRILLPQWHGQGLGSELSHLLISWLRAELGIKRFTKHIRNSNAPAIESAKKLGFRLVRTTAVSSQPDISLYLYTPN